MGFFDDIISRTRKTIDEVENSENRDQDLLEKFWKNRKDLEEALDNSFGEEKEELINLLALFNRKGDENDMESW
ncbi:hypothetical protein LNI95_11535 [Tenacibaculum dicentrarchi]|nr:hypothetical protein [Tenacibaculum dicentrarchi]